MQQVTVMDGAPVRGRLDSPRHWPDVSSPDEASSPAVRYTGAMKMGPDISRIAALLGDPARANILSALMSGRALTAGELGPQAGGTPQTASSHLAQLEAGKLLPRRIQGRHNYFALAGPDVAEVLE